MSLASGTRHWYSNRDESSFGMQKSRSTRKAGMRGSPGPWTELCYRLPFLLLLVALSCSSSVAQDLPEPIARLAWNAQVPIPNELGVAGPAVGIVKDQAGGPRAPEFLLVAGGANFPRPVWETTKIWTDEVLAVRINSNANIFELGEWQPVGNLPRPLAYAACASAAHGIVLVGGNDGEQVFSECFLVK
ncbi:MAG: hypothetical protein AAGG44_21635, partial [Planctomycetota bacterium]